MKVLKMYVDFACPYCLKGYDIIHNILPKFPDVQLDLIPCEAHPRPEVWGKYTDLLAAGYYVAMDQKADLVKYTYAAFDAGVRHKVDIENVDVLKEVFHDVMDVEDLANQLNGKTYAEKINDNNLMAWETLGMPAVPTLYLGDDVLYAIPGVGITAELVEGLLAKGK